MRRPMLGFCVLLASLASAQQGAAGYGQGGQGGGMMGGIGGGGSAGPTVTVNKARPEDDERGWTNRSAILTPGDKVEYKFELKKGEALFAGATSEAFDPALSFVDPQGREIAKNDDREEGDQSPFLAVRAPADGTYLLRVLGYKAASGGKFNLSSLTFLPLDAKLGPATLDLPARKREEDLVFVRLAAKKGVTYDLRTASGSRNSRPVGAYLRRIVGPTGVGSNDVQTIPISDGTTVFRALADGDYYLDYGVNDSTQLSTAFYEVKVIATTPADRTELPLATGEVKVVEFPVQDGSMVRTAIEGKNILSQISAPSGPPVAEYGGNDPTFGNTPAWAYFLFERSSPNDVLRIFHEAGTVRVAVRSQSGEAQTASVRNTDRLPEWEAGKPVRGKLDIGEIRLMTMKSSKSELMKVFAKAAAFQVQLDIFDLQGQRQNTLINRQARNAADDLYFPEAETYLVRLTCDGYGGSGEYTMQRDIPATEPYRLGETQTLKLDGSNFGLHAMNLEAGKRYELIYNDAEGDLRTDLLDEDGQFLRSQAINLDGVVVQYFVPTRSGKHRLWLRGQASTHRFTFRPNVPPKLNPER